MIHGTVLTEHQWEIFRKMCPKWYKWLTGRKDQLEAKLEIEMGNGFTPVDEAHGGSDMWRACPKCTRFASEFYETWRVYGAQDESPKLIEKIPGKWIHRPWYWLLPKFIDHYEEKHIEVAA